jgi:hypothetical protein
MNLPPEILQKIADSRRQACEPYDEALQEVLSIMEESSVVKSVTTDVTTAELREFWPSTKAHIGN